MSDLVIVRLTIYLIFGLGIVCTLFSLDADGIIRLALIFVMIKAMQDLNIL